MKRLSLRQSLAAGTLIALAVTALAFWMLRSAAMHRQERANAALVQAVRQGKEAGARSALQSGASADAYFEPQTFTPISQHKFWHNALFVGHRSLPEDKQYAPVLSLAVANGSKEIAALLLASGADVEAEDGKGSTPLLYAADHNNRDILLELLLRHADASHQNQAGETALHLAIARHNAVNCALLLDNGADPNRVNGEGHAPFDALVIQAGDIHRQWLDASVQALAPSAPDPAVGGSPNTPVILPGKPTLQMVTQQYQRQLRGVRAFANLLIKHGARPLPEAQEFLEDSCRLDPNEARREFNARTGH